MPRARSAMLAWTWCAALAACANTPRVPPPIPASGSIELNQIPLANDGGAGSGTVFFQGKPYSFTIAGLGVGGDAVALLQTSGEAYHLGDLAGFPGAYRQAAGHAAQAGRADGLWLRNQGGVVLHLLTPPGGRMPSLGGDAVLIEMTN